MIKQAIQLAKESGYITSYDCINGQDHFFLDPLFWQSLGKTLGWLDICEGCGNKDTWNIANERIIICDNSECPKFNQEKLYAWHYHWRKFIDHLAENKDPNLFFEELLK